MSLTSALYTGVTGLLANSTAINVIGNNISNVNTTGFKEGRAVFADLLSVKQGNNSQIGLGTQVQAVQNIFSQGSTQTTANVTDLEIQGDSFFALKAPNTSAPVAAQNQAYLSRAGAFTVDNNLTLVNPSGYQVLDTDGNPIKFSDNASAIATAAGTLKTGTTITTALTAINTDLGTITTNVGLMTGAAQTAAQALLTAATNAYNAANTANGNFNTNPSGDNAKAAMVALNNAYAALQAAASASSTTLTAGTPVSNAITAYAPVQTQMGIAFGKITNISNDGVITYLGQDGITQCYYDGSGKPGVLVSNGVPPTTALAVVKVSNPDALNKVGGSLYQPTGNAGVTAAAFTQASNQPNGTTDQIVSNALEGSNVDMASEFVNMIVTQRAYTANSKTITATDQMTQDVLNMIR